MTTELKHPTRKEYMDGKVTHNEYYETIAAESGISFEHSEKLAEIKAALVEDEHLNNIPLKYWDMLSSMAYYSTAPVLKAHGDSWSLAGGVCIAKAAARKAARAL